jgi:hypothetical protein
VDVVPYRGEGIVRLRPRASDPPTAAMNQAMPGGGQQAIRDEVLNKLECCEARFAGDMLGSSLSNEIQFG